MGSIERYPGAGVDHLLRLDDHRTRKVIPVEIPERSRRFCECSSIHLLAPWTYTFRTNLRLAGDLVGARRSVLPERNPSCRESRARLLPSRAPIAELVR
jgi:hypothetical protein